ncbi:response regulator containing a CheY-like receiver domain and an HTH DNA-binding domain [Frankia sp. EI5c]|uniref:response regulator n=1 Tax=Frankia sp. EI5c TaxID=683316 RepID=UPI0007C3F3D8|nr:response regulator transcription factor [Frankia sp. EI5c]OAA23868.1 response regulator containing a CheY-like receiver domain and an HTH DNA-binding domain [Frankia sp. EI5c]
MRVALADDSPHLRAGLRALLASLGAEVVAVLGRGDDLVDAVTGAPATAPVDVALVDMRMPPTHTDEGLRAARQIQALRPGTAVLVFSADDDAPHAAELLRGAPGGAGYVLKSTITDRDRLRSLLGRLVEGDLIVDGDVARQLLSRLGPTSPMAALDEHQRAALLTAMRGEEFDEAVLSGLSESVGLSGLGRHANPGRGAGGGGGRGGHVAREVISWLLTHS